MVHVHDSATQWVEVESAVPSKDKGRGKNGRLMLLMCTNVAYVDQCCLCGSMMLCCYQCCLCPSMLLVSINVACVHQCCLCPSMLLVSINVAYVRLCPYVACVHQCCSCASMLLMCSNVARVHQCCVCTFWGISLDSFE